MGTFSYFAFRWHVGMVATRRNGEVFTVTELELGGRLMCCPRRFTYGDRKIDGVYPLVDGMTSPYDIVGVAHVKPPPASTL